MKYACFSVMCGALPKERVVELVAGAGYEGIEWRVAPDYHVPPDLSMKDAAAVRRLCEDAGLKVVSLSSYLPLEDLAGLTRLARAAREMGCSQLRLKAPQYTGERSYPALLKASHERLRELQDVLEGLGVKGSVEIHFGTIAPSPSLAKRLVGGFDPDCIGVIYDPGNMVFEGLENWRMSLELLGPHLAHVHVKNAEWVREDGSWRPRMAPLREGIVDWGAVLRALAAVGYDGWLSLEDFWEGASLEERLADDIAYLRGLEAEVGGGR